MEYGVKAAERNEWKFGSGIGRVGLLWTEFCEDEEVTSDYLCLVIIATYTVYLPLFIFFFTPGSNPPFSQIPP